MVWQWVGDGTDLRYLSLQTKAECAGVWQALPMAAVLSQTSMPSTRGKDRVKTLTISNCLVRQ